MCGIAGYFSATGAASTDVMRQMIARLVHRGPDDSGVWVNNNIALGHQRLSIVDLSAAGHQPMVSRSGDWVVAYNGEIYNSGALREQLHGPWQGHSDTEVLVAAIEAWGVTAAVQASIGMFAFAALHQPSGKLYLCRDRLGIKPLYYGWAGKQFVFTSELHGLAPMRGELNINHDAIASHLRHCVIPAPASIYQHIAKLPPGYIASIDTRAAPATAVHMEQYWDVASHASAPVRTEPDAELLDQLNTLLHQVVRDRMIADVPLGAFLSGGYDSSLVCALMQAQSPVPIKTFTIGFNNPKFNEAEHAKTVATHLGTEHTELYVGEEDLLAAVDELPRLMDEPFADSSILPTFLVSRLAREHVTVALSGDGGDELFWGYNRYPDTERIFRKWGRIPAWLGRAAVPVMGADITGRLTRKIRTPAWGGREGTLDQKLRTASQLLACASDFNRMYEAMMSHWRSPTDVVLNSRELQTAYNNPQHWARQYDNWPRMAWLDTVGYLPDDILTKVDRASMAVSLEARVPLIDHRVVEFAARLPAHLKLNGSTAKFGLRHVLGQYVPASITDRPKMGFGVPLDDWLRGPLQEWAMDLLAPATLAAQNIFDPQPIQKLLKDHVADRANNSAMLWDVLTVQVWLASQRAA